MTNEMLEDLRLILEKELEEKGYELIDLEFVHEDGDFYLRLFIWNEEGITIEDTEIVARYLSERLDEIDPIDKQYYLEVSSPDLNRALKTTDDLRRNMHNEVVVKLYKKIDGSKEYDGFIVDYSDDHLTILMENDVEKKFDRKDISLIKQLVRF